MSKPAVYVDGKPVGFVNEVRKEPWSRNPFRLLRQIIRGRKKYAMVTLDRAAPAGTFITIVQEIDPQELLK